MDKNCKRCDTVITEWQTYCYDCLPHLIEETEDLMADIKHEIRLHRQLKREEKEFIRKRIKQDIYTQGQDLQTE